MTSIRKAKKLGIYKPKKVDAVLYRDVKKQVGEANRRLRQLQNKGEFNTWASKKLFNRLDDKNLSILKYNRGNRSKKRKDYYYTIKLNKNLTNTNLLDIQKSTRQFLVSKTSTLKGIEDVKKRTIKSIKDTLNEKDGKKVTQEDAEFYYDLLDNKDFDSFVDKIGASSMWNLVDTSINKKDSEENWINRLEMYAMTMNDKQMRTRAENLYKKYIKPKVKKTG